jgi:hypothetical protein
MPIISGTTKAPTYCRLGKGRLGATRLNYYQPVLFFRLNGVDVTANVRQAGFSLTKTLNGEADSLGLKIEGFTDSDVLLGKYIELYMGGVQNELMLFSGNIQAADMSFENENSNTVIHEIHAVGYRWQLSNILIRQTYVSNTYATVLNSIITGWAPSLTLDTSKLSVAANTLDEVTLTNETLRDAFDRIANYADAHWYTTANTSGYRTIHFADNVTSNTGTANPVVRSTSGWGYSGVRERKDASRICAKVWSAGKGTTVLSQVPGTPATISIPVADASMFDEFGVRANTVTVNTEIGTVTCTPYLVSGTTRFGYWFARHVGNSNVTVVTANTAALSINLPVADMGVMSGGWAKVRDKYFSHTREGLSGPGNLGLFNTYAYDSLTVNAVVGDTVTPVSSLVQISSLTEDLPLGAEVHLEWLCEATINANAYPVSSVLSPSDFTQTIADGRLSSPEAMKRGVATLVRDFNPVVTISWKTRDLTHLPGQFVTVNASVGVTANTYLVQGVTLTREMLPPNTSVYPMRSVEASSVKETFAAIMRRLSAQGQGIN